MKALTLLLVILIALLQYPLWLGKGSWLRVWDLNRKITEQEHKNAVLKARNDTLDAEVRDLKNGKAAIEERARSELGMIKTDEVFYQVIENPIIESTNTNSPMTGVVVAPPLSPIDSVEKVEPSANTKPQMPSNMKNDIVKNGTPKKPQ